MKYAVDISFEEALILQAFEEAAFLALELVVCNENEFLVFIHEIDGLYPRLPKAS